MALRGADEKEEKAEITLGILNAVNRDNAVTQRSLAKELGVALGIANAVLNRCVDKGLVKVRHIPARRYAYYLTPTGFSEKSRLTAQYLSNSLRFFRDAREQLDEILGFCEQKHLRQIAFIGAGDLAELAKLCSHEMDVTVVAMLEAVEDLRGRRIDALVVTDTRSPQATFDAAVAAAPKLGLSSDRIFAPKLLNISRTSVTSVT